MGWGPLLDLAVAARGCPAERREVELARDDVKRRELSSGTGAPSRVDCGAWEDISVLAVNASLLCNIVGVIGWEILLRGAGGILSCMTHVDAEVPGHFRLPGWRGWVSV